MKYADAIEAQLRVLSTQSLPSKNTLIGKALEKGSAALLALDQLDNVHLLFPNLSDSPEALKRLSKFDQRFLHFRVKRWVVSGLPEREYLDVACLADRHSEYRKPFVHFSSDCLVELQASSKGLAACIHQVARRWNRFWAPSAQELTPEWVKGLLGELWLLDDLLKSFGVGAVGAWTGSDRLPHDFQANQIALECKTTETMPPTIRVNGLAQLDYKLFKHLWIVVHTVSSIEGGEAIPDVVARIEGRILDDTSQEEFLKKLEATGYKRHLEARYREFNYTRNKTIVYVVNNAFPTLTNRSLHKPLDYRISAISYTVSLLGLKPLSLKSRRFQTHLRILCNAR